MAVKSVLANYDQEWVDLILEALRIGISPEEIRYFLGQVAATDKRTDGVSSN